MLAKWKLELISFLSSLTLISVGFSSWNISSSVPVIETVDGTVQTDYVIKTDEYISLEVDLPTYVEEGYILKDNKDVYSLSNIGTLTLTFIVDYEHCCGENSALIANGDTYLNINCTFTLKNNASTFFTQHSISIDTYDMGLSGTPYIPEEQQSTFFEIELQNYPFRQLNADGTISITLTLTTNNQNNVYNLFNNNAFIFDIEVHGHQ